MTDQTPCPRCQFAFVPSRSNQKYCSRPCQKAATLHTARGPRTKADSAEERRRQEGRKNRLRGLSAAFFGTSPAYRAEFMEKLIAEGRGNRELRQWMIKREFLVSWFRYEGTGWLHIANCLDHYSLEVYGIRSFAILDPATELPPAADLAFPAKYFGPDAPSIYEDGGLKKRPCPWSADRKATVLQPSKPTSSGRYDWRYLAKAMRDQGWQRYFTL